MGILKDIQRAYDLVYPPVHYATSEAITPGKVIRYDGTLGGRPFILIHPDDLAQLKAQLPKHRWVHLRDVPIDPSQWTL